MRCNRPEIRQHHIAASLRLWEAPAPKAAVLEPSALQGGPATTSGGETIHVKSPDLR
jgi:hypothetical protein